MFSQNISFLVPAIVVNVLNCFWNPHFHEIMKYKTNEEPQKNDSPEQYHKELHCVKYHNFTQFPGVEILWKGELPETIRKLCLSTKFPHQEIR